MQQKACSLPLRFSLYPPSYILQPQFVHTVKVGSIATDTSAEKRLNSSLQSSKPSSVSSKTFFIFLPTGFSECVTDPFSSSSLRKGYTRPVSYTHLTLPT